MKERKYLPAAAAAAVQNVFAKKENPGGLC